MEKRWEEMLWKQRLRVSWLKNGDKNTRVVHEHVKMWGRQNMIKSIADNHGV